MAWAGDVFARLVAATERMLELERGQIALWSPIALGTGIAAWFVLPTRGQWAAVICTGLAAATILLLVARGRGRLARILGLGCLLIVAGCLLAWGKAVSIAAPALSRPAFVTLSGTVTRAEMLEARGMVRLTVMPIARADLPLRLRINVALKDLASSSQVRGGDVVRLRVRLMPPAPPALPGAYDFARRAYFDGIGATGRAVPPIVIMRHAASRGPSLRERLSAHVAQQAGSGPGAIAVALATGDRGGIATEDEEAMRRSGLTHLLSISGLHVTALIGAVILIVYRVLALSTVLALRWPLMLIAAGAGAAAGIGYTLLTGAEVPTIRSCVTALLIMAGLALGREAISLRLLACGALFVMLLWPEAVIGPSFQLSFAAVTAIVCLYEHPQMRRLFQARGEPVWRKAARLGGGLLVTGLAVEIVLAPIALFHFHRTGLLGAFANMVAIPLTEFVIMPAEALALLLDLGGLGAPAWWVVDKALRLLLALAHGVGGQTAAVALMPAIPNWAFAVTMAGLLWCMLWRTRLRWAGVPAIIVGVIGYATAPVPDLIVSADGHHVALRLADGRMALLRAKAGDYMREQLAEQAAFDGEITDLASLSQARCSEDMCMVDFGYGGRVLMTRSRLSVPWETLIAACAAANVVIADRRLPDGCTPRWLKLDRLELARRGGASIALDRRWVTRSKPPYDDHPWATLPTKLTKLTGWHPFARPYRPSTAKPPH